MALSKLETSERNRQRQFDRYQTDTEYRQAKINRAIEYRIKNRDSILTKERARHALLRLEVIEKLGGRCATCGFADYRAIEIDHINGDGYKESGRNLAFYRRILKLEDTSRYQLLCINCHKIKTAENKDYVRYKTQALTPQ